MLHVRQFEEKNYALCRKFKTNSTYIYQPVMIGPEVKRLLLEVYVGILRPLLVPRVRAQDEDHLFRNYAGKSEGLFIGRLVTSYFRRKLDLSITLTTIRSVIETDCAGKLARGEITQAQRNAILVINGHSEKIANEFYVLQEMDDIVERGLEAQGLSTSTPRTTPSTSTTAYVVDTWGRDHPDFNKEGKARWTDTEKDFLLAVVDDIMSEQASTERPPRLMADCLRRIREDPSTRHIFHKRHIAKSDRLRAGYEVAMASAKRPGANRCGANRPEIVPAGVHSLIATTIQTAQSAII